MAIQTNLACRLDWLADADPTRLALWATYHPGQVDPAALPGPLRELDAHGIRYSVGVVGLPGHLAEARPCAPRCRRRSTCGSTRPTGTHYDAADGGGLDGARPAVRLQRAPARVGRARLPRRGDRHLGGRRRHGPPLPLHRRRRWATSTTASYARRLGPRACTNATCDCHIGYVHLKPAAARRRLRRRHPGTHPGRPPAHLGRPGRRTGAGQLCTSGEYCSSVTWNVQATPARAVRVSGGTRRK